MVRRLTKRKTRRSKRNKRRSSSKSKRRKSRHMRGGITMNTEIVKKYIQTKACKTFKTCIFDEDKSNDMTDKDSNGITYFVTSCTSAPASIGGKSRRSRRSKKKN